MLPLEAIEYALDKDLVDNRGKRVELKLSSGLMESEIDELEQTLPCPVPETVRQLLRRTAGVTWSSEQMDFTGKEMDFGMEDVFPSPHPIAHDGFGNFWVVDLSPESTDWGPIYFACHDAPIILFQSPNLASFILEFVRSYEPPFDSLVTKVREDSLFNVWRTNPSVLTWDESRQAGERELASFAATLDDSWHIIDLRQAQPGQGFSWGRYGPRTELRRHGSLPIFGYRKPQNKKGLFSFFGR